MSNTISSKKSSDRSIVLHHLVNNLKTLRPDIEWSLKHSLVQKYARKMSTRYRHYHTFTHIAECLTLLDEHKEFVRDMQISRAALIFHDVVYVPGAVDNEEKSGDFAAQFYDESQMIQIRSHIMATKHEFPFSSIKNGDYDILADIDLEILSRSLTQFLRYRDQIREEYSLVDPSVFMDGTIKFLRAFKEQSESDGIYRTEVFGKKESSAYNNICSLLEMLR